jgi:hypothetical protein
MRPILSLAALLLAAAPALAQTDNRCGRLQAELDTLSRAAPVEEVRVEQYRDAIDRQTDELDRTRDYARSIGCDVESGGQCASLVANIRRMQRNLAVLQNQYQRLEATAGAQRDTERQRVEATMADLGCNGGAPAAGQRSAGFYEQLFGPDETDPGYALPPSAGEPVQPDAATAEPQPAGSNLRTICVRKCDGFFFPISFSTNAASFPSDAEACRQQCPTAEVELYYYDTFSQQPDDALSTVTGQPLRSMPNAFKFRTKFDQSCTCKAAGQGVAQSLAPAEEALKRLDAEAADEAAGKALGKAAGKAQASGQGPDGPAAAVSPKPKVADSLPLSAGKTTEVTTPDGQKKKVRVVGPSFEPAQHP